LEINSTNWYLNLKIFDVNEEIENVVKELEKKYRSEDVLSDISSLILGSQIHGQLIDSQPSKHGLPESRKAEIILGVTRNLKNTYCIKYNILYIFC